MSMLPTGLATIQASMTSREIADLTGKQHAHVMRDIRAMIERLEADPNLDWHCETEHYIDEQGKAREMYRLDKDTIMCLIAGYDPIPRMRIIKRWQELESGAALPHVTDPVLASLVKGLIEIDRVKQQQDVILQRQTEIDRKAALLESRLEHVEIQHRNGVPDGYLSKKQAHHLYGVGLSEEVFHLALTKIGVPVKPYIHRGEDGYETPSQAYLEDEIASALDLFLEDARQVSAQMCASPMLGGKRFRYVKEAAA